MKTTKLLLLAQLVGYLLIINSGCTKENPATGVITPLPALPPPTIINTPPKVFTNNIAVFLPVDSAFLSGCVTDAENNIDSYKWRQLTGLGQPIIQTPDSLNTEILKLTKGEYSFEFTVTDKGSLSGRDTTNIAVLDTAGPNNMIFKNLYAGCWGGECLLVMDGSSIPRNIPIKVFFKPEDTSTWIETHAYFFTSTDKYFRVQFGGSEMQETKNWEVMIMY